MALAPDGGFSGEAGGSSPAPLILRGGLAPAALQRELLAARRGTDAGRRALAFYLAEVRERRLHQLWGFSSTEQFAEARLDMGRRVARELIRAGRDLLDLPAVDASFCKGRLSWTKVRLLLSVVEPATERAWVELAEGLSVRDLERRVRRSRKGDGPEKGDGYGIGEVAFRVTARVGTLVFAMIEKAREKAAAILGEEVTDELLLSTLAGAFLESRRPGEERHGHGPFLIVASAGASGAMEVETPDGPLPLDRNTSEMMLCDAGVQRACACKAPVDSPSGRDAPTPEGLRRRVLARDGYRCLACRSTVNLHAHHIRFRSEGGPTVASNLATLCVRCHTLVHEDLLRVSGTAPAELVFTDRRGEALQREGNEPGALRIERTGTPASPSPVQPDLTLDHLPAEADRSWWRRHEHLFAWNGRRGTLDLSPGAGLPEGEPGEPPARGPAAPAAVPPGPDLDGLVGQGRVVRALSAAVRAACTEDRPVVHTLLHGPAGCGKTAMALAIGRSRGVRTHTTSGPALSTPGVLAGLLCSLEANDILFIDEIHALPRPVAETLYEVMEGGTLSLPVSEGFRTRTLTLRLPPVTVAGATTEAHALPHALLSRFALEETVELYSDGELARIVSLAAAKRGRAITGEAALVLARASLGTPRRAKALLSRVCDMASDLARARQPLDAACAREALAAAGIDARGLGPDHRRAVGHLNARGGPLGAARLAALLGLTPKAFRTMLEPDLLRLGVVVPTPRGLVLSG